MLVSSIVAQHKTLSMEAQSRNFIPKSKITTPCIYSLTTEDLLALAELQNAFCHRRKTVHVVLIFKDAVKQYEFSILESVCIVQYLCIHSAVNMKKCKYHSAAGLLTWIRV